MRKLQVQIIATGALLAALTAGCASGPATRFEKDPAVDFRAYKTFAFLRVADKSRYTTITSRRLELATRSQLERLGYVYRLSHADLQVNVTVKIAKRQELRAVPGPRYGAWPGQANIETLNYREGTLVIDLVDAGKNALVWRGVAEGRINANASKDPGPAVDRAVSKFFAGFPGAAARSQT